MTLEELIRQQVEKYMTWAIRDNQQAAVSDDLANRIRLSTRSDAYNVVVDGLLTALRNAEDVAQNKKPASVHSTDRPRGDGFPTSNHLEE